MHSMMIVRLVAVIWVLLISAGTVSLAHDSNLSEIFKSKARQLSSYDDVDGLVEFINDQRLILLGESTHGTSQYYIVRAEISKKLITEKGFSFVAVEGDWSSIYNLNLYVKGLLSRHETSAKEIMQTFSRWPEWMWANRETLEFIEWIKDYNAGKDMSDMVGFYGIDVYGHWEAMDRLLDYADDFFPEGRDVMRSNSECFAAHRQDEWGYTRAVQGGAASCEDRLKEIVEMLQNSGDSLRRDNEIKYFEALQNASVLKNAEQFYRLAAIPGPASWNSRARHFHETVVRLLDVYGEDSRGVVWAHNTHVGDARATSMDLQGMVNIGRLVREAFGPDAVFIVGFATHSGTVLAGRKWGSLVERMTIPPPVRSSLEDKLSAVEHDRFFMVFDEDYEPDHALLRPVGHRAIGVTYNPRNERGNYVPTILPARYDALVFFRKTDALEAIHGPSSEVF